MEWHVSSTLRAAGQVAARKDAPLDERQEAVLVAAREVAPVAKAIPIRDIMALAKAYEPPPKEHLARMAKVVLPVEDSLGRALWLTRPVGLDFPQLKRIVAEDPVLKAIIWTRIQQVQRFLRPSAQEWKPGFRIRFRDRKRKVTPEDEARFAWLEQYLLSCGAEFDPRRRRALRRDNLWDWTAKHLQDSLSLDAAPVELVPTPSGRTHGWVHVDGGSVYLVDPLATEALEGNVPEVVHRYGLDLPDPSQVVAVLVREGRIIAWYTHEDLLYRVRRPRTESWSLGYGQPEPEDLLKIVTGFLNALTLNLRGFSHNSIPKGILTLYGDFTPEDIEQFKAEWDAYISGVQGRWRVPVLFTQGGESQAGASFIPIGNEFNEMYFSKWMTFLVAIKAALYGMDPEEINFESFTARPSTLSGSDTEERLASSKDKGLWPLLQFLRFTLIEILYTVDPDVELDWTGLEVDQQASRQDEEKMLTLGEYRQRRGEAPPENEILANAPLNPALLSIYMQSLQAQEQGGEQETEPSPEPEEPPEPPQGPREELGPGDYEDEEGNGWRAKDEKPEPPEDDFIGKAWYPLDGLGDLGEDDGL
jgi:hypothetical protein